MLNRAPDGAPGDVLGGSPCALAEFLPLVYAELRALAEACFREERGNHTLQPTALVHEAYVRLVDQSSIEWRGRSQFFVIAAKVMRNILVDHARGRGRLKRGGGWQEVTLDAIERSLAVEAGGGSSTSEDAPDELPRLHEALDRLATHDARKARLVELRFFAGLTLDQAAEILGVARSTASEDWRMARAWLHRELRGARGADG